MPEVHDAKRIVEAIFDAFDESKGGEIKDGVRFHLPQQFSLVVTRYADEGIEVAFAPPLALYAKKFFVNWHGRLERLVVTKESVVAEIDGLPDQTFRIVS